MTKTETLRQLSDAANEKRVERLATQIESLRQAKLQSVEELAATLEPLAQAMAALTDETRQTLAEIDRRSREQSELFQRQLSESTAAARKAAEKLSRASQRMEWRHYALAALTGALTAALVTVFWLWLAPPKVENLLDARAVAEHLKPAVIEALTPSKGR